MHFKEKIENQIKKKERKISEILSSRLCRSFIALIIIIGTSSIILQSFDTKNEYLTSFQTISFFCAFIFTIEYILRVISAPADYPHKHSFKARFTYIISFMGIIDFFSILPFTIIYHPTIHDYKEIVELGKIFIIFKTFRYTTSYRVIKQVISTVKYELFVAFSMSIIIISFCAILMYYIEREAQPEAFSNIGEGFWWAIITFTSVGYGDVYPITTVGKIIASIMATIGVMTLSLPTAIISGSFVEYLQNHKNHKKDSPDSNFNS